MITREDLAPLAFIKKADLTGSFQGMRFKLYKKTVGEETMLGLAIWPEPFNFVKTNEEEKLFTEFEFNDDGIDDAVRYLNSVWIENQSRWEEGKRWNLKLF